MTYNATNESVTSCDGFMATESYVGTMRESKQQRKSEREREERSGEIHALLQLHAPDSIDVFCYCGLWKRSDYIFSVILGFFPS